MCVCVCSDLVLVLVICYFSFRRTLVMVYLMTMAVTKRTKRYSVGYGIINVNYAEECDRNLI